MPTKSNNIGGRGGRRPGAGRKKSAVKEKANNGNPGGRKLEAEIMWLGAAIRILRIRMPVQ